MKLKMAENSLFAILLRKPWWISIGIAIVVSLAASTLFPRAIAAYGISAGVPFLIIGVMAFYRQMRVPSQAQVVRTLETVGAMSWRDFSAAVEAGYRRDGYEVKRLEAGAADFEITRAGRTSLVSCKRWKAAGTGVEPLRELHEQADARDARECIYIGTGQLTDTARRFAAEKKIRVVQGTGLAELLR